MRTRAFALVIVAAIGVSTATASAQAQPPDVQSRLQTLEQQVEQLKAELAALRAQMTAAPAPQQPPGVATPSTVLVPPPKQARADYRHLQRHRFRRMVRRRQAAKSSIPTSA